MYMCASYAPKVKVDTTRRDSAAINEEIILDENGNPVVRENSNSEEKANGEKKQEENGEKKEKKEKKKAKPAEQVINFDDL